MAKKKKKRYRFDIDENSTKYKDLDLKIDGIHDYAEIIGPCMEFFKPDGGYDQYLKGRRILAEEVLKILKEPDDAKKQKQEKTQGGSTKT